jgi:outer membrane protein OmpA-like peptidoglycan-associated protein
MKNHLLMTILVVLLAGLFSTTLFAQYHSEGIKGGFSLGMTTGMTDVEKDQNYKLGPQGRVFVRYPLFGMGFLQGEFGLTSGMLKGETYSTGIVPLDYRFLISPLKFETWNPYLYAGAGVLFYENQRVPSNSAGMENKNTTTGVIPVGLGLQFKVGESTALEFTAGYNYTLKDELEATALESDKDAYLNVSVGLTVQGENPNGDPDQDGLINKVENMLKTNKKVADTDGDGLSDGEEYNKYKTDPLVADSDQDGLTDKEEVKTYSTNPLKKDSDDDGLGDKEEVSQHKTDPNKADSDNDGLTDVEELTNSKTKPMAADTDNDGLKDGDELKNHKTDPLKSDSDSDGLNDGDEVLKQKTNPLVADTDGDGLNDGAEVMTHKTSPLKKDTDAGTVDDGVEVKRGTNPLAAGDDVAKEEQIKGAVGTEIVLEGIVFDSGSSKLRPQSMETLNKIVKTMLENPEIAVEIAGHTDNKGKRAANLKLSLARAESVAKYLASKGVAKSQMVSKGYGPDKPTVPNDTPEGRQQNRRIAFTRIK